MAIYEELNTKLKEAMLAKDSVAKNYIRSIKSKLTEHEVAEGLDRDATPNDELMMTIISAHKKSLEKAIKQLEKGGESSLHLVTEYQGEIDFCSKFLPDDADLMKDVEHIVEDAIKNVGNNVGKVMGYIMKNNKSLDGSVVKAAVIKKLQG